MEEAKASGSFGSTSWSRQYRSAVFCHNPQQRQLAQAAGITEVEEYRFFTPAEDYHQKYYLRQSPLVDEISSQFPLPAQFRESPLAMRANAVVAGYFSADWIREWHRAANLPPSTQSQWLRYAGREQLRCR